MDLDKYFVKSELIPAVIQEHGTKKVLMLAYMNKESLAKTLETGYTWFFSRSRQKLWNKGETSGHTQKVVSIKGDCRRRYAAYRGNTKRPCLPYGQQDLLF